MDIFQEITASTPANDRFFEENVDETFKELPQDGFVKLDDNLGNTGGDLWCEAGEHSFTRAPGSRGRAPKNCPEHRRVAGKATGTRGIGRNKLEKEVTEDLTASFMMASKGFGAMAPVTAVVMAERSLRTAEAIVSVSKNNPRMMAALQKASKAAPVMTIAETVGCLVVATQVDTGRLEPDHFICTLTEVDKAYVKVHGPYFKPPQTSKNTQELMETFVPIA